MVLLVAPKPIIIGSDALDKAIRGWRYPLWRRCGAAMTPGPTVRRRRLGTELRKLREASGYKLEEVAAQLGVAPSTLSRIETGKAPTKSAYLNQMLAMYGAVEPGHRQDP